MNCNCKWIESVLALVVLVFAVWPDMLGLVVSKWIVIVAAVLLFIHAWTCKSCCNTSGSKMMAAGMNSKSTKKKTAKKR